MDTKPGWKTSESWGYALAALAGVATQSGLMEPVAYQAALALCPAWVQVAAPLVQQALGLLFTLVSVHQYAGTRSAQKADQVYYTAAGAAKAAAHSTTGRRARAAQKENES